jgi:hypothetical protein
MTFFREEDVYRAFGLRVTKKGKIKNIKRQRINGMRPHFVILDEIKEYTEEERTCPTCGDRDFRHLPSCTAQRNAPIQWVNSHERTCACFYCRYDVMEPEPTR